MHASRFDAMTRRLAAIGPNRFSPAADFGAAIVGLNARVGSGRDAAGNAHTCCVYSCSRGVTSYTTITCHVGACPPIAGCTPVGTGLCDECGRVG